jgi:hypothetical protein
MVLKQTTYVFFRLCLVLLGQFSSSVTSELVKDPQILWTHHVTQNIDLTFG